MAAKTQSSYTLERRIHFYRIHSGLDVAGMPISFDPCTALSKISALNFSEVNGRYLTGIDGSALCGWVDNDSPDRPRMRFGQIRRTGLPQIEKLGTLTDLNIAVDEGLVEYVHVVFFENNIAGADFNFYGPRLTRLGYYINIKAGDLTPLPKFEPLLRLDALNQLNRLRDVRLFDLKIRPSFVDAIRQADLDLGAAFEAARNLGNTENIEILLRPAGDQRSLVGALSAALDYPMTLGRRLVNAAKKLSLRDDLRVETKKFIVEGKRQDTDRVEPIDLLRDQLISHKQIIRQGERSRALDSVSAYAAIEASYDELKDELLKAASLSL